jgi:hypothetical protein
MLNWVSSSAACESRSPVHAEPSSCCTACGRHTGPSRNPWLGSSLQRNINCSEQLMRDLIASTRLTANTSCAVCHCNSGFIGPALLCTQWHTLHASIASMWFKSPDTTGVRSASCVCGGCSFIAGQRAPRTGRGPGTPGVAQPQYRLATDLSTDDRVTP